MPLPTSIHVLHLTEDADGVSRFADLVAPLRMAPFAPTSAPDPRLFA